MVDVIAAARAADVPVVYVNDDRNRWDGDAPALAREAADGAGGDVVQPLLPQPGDSVLLKHRYSGFDHTALELLLASLRVERVLLALGTATEGCVVQTAIDAREHGLKATILADACATTGPRSGTDCAPLRRRRRRHPRPTFGVMGGPEINRTCDLWD